MTEYCEIVEDNAHAESECPVTDNIMVEVSSANGQSTALPVTDYPLIESEATCTSQVVIDAYAVLTGAAMAESDLSHTLVVTSMLSSTGRARSSVKTFLDELAAAAAEAQSEIAYADAPTLLLSAAQATSSVAADTVAEFSVQDSARAQSSVSLGLLESLTSGADAASMVVVLRRVNEMVVSSADGSSEAYPASVPQDFLLLSTGNAASLVLMQTAHQSLITSTAVADADVWYKDPARVAWVMNTETTAASWYDNFDFESIAQPPGAVLAVGPDGLYELTGETDSGEQIDASVVSGFTDFGLPQTKRVDYMYFGYTSSGRISVTAETYESGHSPATYFLEERLAEAPRNSRVQPGKGLFGRYWRMTIRNVEGADFEIHDATVDIAVSNRKV
jgi:hypothetical protein